MNGLIKQSVLGIPSDDGKQKKNAIKQIIKKHNDAKKKRKRDEKNERRTNRRK